MEEVCEFRREFAVYDGAVCCCSVALSLLLNINVKKLSFCNNVYGR